MNRRHSCRITHGFSRIFGLWPMAGARNIPLLFLSRRFRRWRRFFFVEVFLSHRFRRYTQIFFIMIFLHRISRMNRRHSCLSDYSRNFAELWPLANGWRPIYAPVVFCPIDFTDIHRFFMESLVNLFVSLRGYLQRPDRSHPWKSVSNRLRRKSPNKFRVIRWIKSASSAKSAWLKNSDEKSVYICEICGTFSNLRGYL